MAELINLRAARKRAKRRDEDVRAASNRLAHGQPKSKRLLNTAQRDKARQDLDRHRIETGDGNELPGCQALNRDRGA